MCKKKPPIIVLLKQYGVHMKYLRKTHEEELIAVEVDSRQGELGLA